MGKSVLTMRRNLLTTEDHEEHEEIIEPLETHFSCPSCAWW